MYQKVKVKKLISKRIKIVEKEVKMFQSLIARLMIITISYNYFINTFQKCISLEPKKSILKPRSIIKTVLNVIVYQRCWVFLNLLNQYQLY